MAKKAYEPPVIIDETVSGELDELLEATVFSDEPTEEKPAFEIDNDAKADWALRKIKAKFDKYERLKALAIMRKAEIDAALEVERKRYENGTDYLKSKLYQYFKTVEHENTKTEEHYKLLTGTLKAKKASREYVHDDKALTEWMKENGYEDFVKVEESPRWGEFKKRLEMTPDGVAVIKVSGEIVEGVTVEETPEKFDIKF